MLATLLRTRGALAAARAGGAARAASGAAGGAARAASGAAGGAARAASGAAGGAARAASGAAGGAARAASGAAGGAASGAAGGAARAASGAAGGAARAASGAAGEGPVVLERLAGADRGIALYGLSAPRSRNALGHELVAAMRAAHRLIREDRGLSVVVLHSTVPGIFCAGANLKERLSMSDGEVVSFVRALRETLAEVAGLPQPVLAALDGAALGGGLELALAADLRVAADGARLGLVETGRGLIPGAGGTQRLPRLVQPHVAKELIFTSRVITGKEAKEMGLVNHCVPQNASKTAALERALQLAREILPNAPVALRCAKRAIDEGMQVPLEDGYEVEQKWYEVIVPTKDRREGLVSFMEKRKPVYEGH